MCDVESEAIHIFISQIREQKKGSFKSKLITSNPISQSTMEDPLKHITCRKTCGFMCTNAKMQLTHIHPFSWISVCQAQVTLSKCLSSNSIPSRNPPRQYAFLAQCHFLVELQCCCYDVIGFGGKKKKLTVYAFQATFHV